MRVLIICGGEPPSKELLAKEIIKSDLTIGADSGGNIIFDAGFKPDIVIGDLDSFDVNKHDDVEYLKIAEQETNDLEKSLNYAVQKGAEDCIVLGILGRRIDHTFKNLSVLAQFSSKFKNLIFRDDYGDTFLITSPFKMDIDVGTVVSFIPLSGKITGITTRGVQYPLQNEMLQVGVRDGTSNMAIEPTISATFGAGDMILFVGNGLKMK